MLPAVAPRRLALASFWLVILGGCRDEPAPVEHHAPMPTPEELAAAVPPDRGEEEDGADTGETGETGEEPPRERPPADPEIARALDLISSSGLRFIDQAADADSRASEYTAEQFASMLRSKWDWIGYDITKLDPWLDEIASRSFKTNLPYLVVLEDGSKTQLRPWLQAKLDASEAP